MMSWPRLVTKPVEGVTDVRNLWSLNCPTCLSFFPKQAMSHAHVPLHTLFPLLECPASLFVPSPSFWSSPDTYLLLLWSPWSSPAGISSLPSALSRYQLYISRRASSILCHVSHQSMSSLRKGAMTFICWIHSAWCVYLAHRCSGELHCGILVPRWWLCIYEAAEVQQQRKLCCVNYPRLKEELQAWKKSLQGGEKIPNL